MRSLGVLARARRLVLVVCLALAACDDKVLLEKLDQHQANETLSALQRRNIAAQKVNQGKSGYEIVVPKEDFTAAVDTLDALDLPPRPRVEISQAFPNDAMVSSPIAERARLLSLVEQRLEQTIVTIDSVDRVSVHLSYPIDDMSSAGTRPIHIAALIVHEPGVDEQELIAKLKRFMRNAVVNANYDDISITLFERAPSQIAPPVKAGTAITEHRFWGFWLFGALACIGVIVLAAKGVRRVRGIGLTRTLTGGLTDGFTEGFTGLTPIGTAARSASANPRAPRADASPESI